MTAPESAGAPPIPFVNRIARGKAHDQAPTGTELAALAALSLLDWALYFGGAYTFVQVMSPLGLIAILGFANFDVATKNPGALWTPIFSFRLGTLVFLGVGALAPFVITADGVDYIYNMYSFSAQEGAKVVLVWTVATVLTLGGAKLVGRVAAAKPLKHHAATVVAGPDNALKVGIAYFLLGFGFDVLFNIPRYMGSGFDIAIPGAVQMGFAALNAVGLFLVSLVAFRRGGLLVLVVVLLLALNLFVSIITTNKSLLLLPLVFVSLSYLMQGVTLKRLAIVVAALSGALFVLQPMISNSRLALAQRYGSITEGGLDERVQLAIDYVAGDRFEASEAGESSLLRLSYVNVAAYAVSRYDAHQPSKTLESALIGLIPRVIWPEKPSTSAAGSEIWFEITGTEGSSTGVTLAAEAYWNLGWAGLVIVFPLFGIGLMIASNVCLRIVDERNWAMMPFVLMCFGVGLSVDGLVIVSVLAPGMIAFVAYWVLKVGLTLVLKSAPQRRRQPRWQAG